MKRCGHGVLRVRASVSVLSRAFELQDRWCRDKTLRMGFQHVHKFRTSLRSLKETIALLTHEIRWRPSRTSTSPCINVGLRVFVAVRCCPSWRQQRSRNAQQSAKVGKVTCAEIEPQPDLIGGTHALASFASATPPPPSHRLLS